MDVEKFFLLLLHSLSNLDFVKEIDVHREVFIVKGRVYLEKKRILQVYFNQITGTTAFALIEEEKRLWGIDFDNFKGWHLHPLESPESHKDINPPSSIDEIMKMLKSVWLSLG